jgi:hypothetical protein
MITAVYVLWGGDSYVEMNGDIEPPYIIGIFTSINEMNKVVQQKYFNMPCSMQENLFSDTKKRFSQKGRYGNELYCYYEVMQLNCLLR